MRPRRDRLFQSHLHVVSHRWFLVHASVTPPPRPGHTWHLDEVCVTLTTVQAAHARPCSRAQTHGRAACRGSPAPSR